LQHGDTTTPASRRPTITACAVIAVAVSSGCDDSQVGGAGSATAPPTASKSETAGGSPSAPVPASIQPSAKDGTNYKACLGGDCEIAVSEPVTITLFDDRFDGGPFTVRKVNAGSVEVGMVTPAGPRLDTTIDKGCTTTFFANAASGAAITRCPGVPDDIVGMYIKQTVTVVGITDGTAILRLESM
jgi:hypothetical protein